MAALPTGLLIDDNDLIRLTVEESLLMEKIPLHTTDSIREALDWIENRPMSFILSDHRMPQMSGVDLLKVAWQHQPSTPRILLTGALNQDTLIRAVNEAHIFAVLQKPWQLEELIGTLHAAIESYRACMQAT